jgi:hypothetical protein
LHWSRDQWGSFIAAQLILGEFPGRGPILGYWLKGLVSKDPTTVAYVSAFMAAVGKNDVGPLFRAITCHELSSSWLYSRQILNGNLIATGGDVCDGSGLAEPYDSAHWQPTVPITYFHEPFDPTTTTEQARYHLDNHTVARQFVTVPGASHASLTLGLAGRGCAPAVWHALSRAADELGTALATCTKPGEPPITLEIRP